nr:spermatogenesis-associated protein 3 isoform X4 [Bubalus bubalis]
MKKGKRKKSETRRRGSTSLHASSESTPQQQSSESSSQQPVSGSSPRPPSPKPTSQLPSSGSAPLTPNPAPAPPPPSPGPTPQQPSSGCTSQPSSNSTPPQPAPRALPAPEVSHSHSARDIVSPDPNSKASSRSKKAALLAGVVWASATAASSMSFCLGPGRPCQGEDSQTSSPFTGMSTKAQLPPTHGFSALLCRRPPRKHSTHRNSRAPSPRNCCCGSGSPRSCLLHP